MKELCKIITLACRVFIHLRGNYHILEIITTFKKAVTAKQLQCLRSLHVVEKIFCCTVFSIFIYFL